jgi:multiple sugar transport system ATP-binding protein
MHDGRVEQIGTPLDLYDRPGNLFVAQFIGSPAMNVIEGTVCRGNGAAHVAAAGGMCWPLGDAAGAEGQRVAYGIRPEHLALASAGASGSVTGEIVVVEPTGAQTELLVQAGEAQIVLITHGRPTVGAGDQIGIAIDPGMVHVFDKASGERLAA